MPAITADVLTLPRIPAPDPATTTERPVRSVTTAPSGFEGEGFPVRRAFASVPAAALDPFIHMDQMGEVEYAPGEPKGTPWHPHRGFETVTYMIDGTFEHRDSNGGSGTILDGDTQWMTAGRGVLHIERPPEQLVASGGLFHGVQLWVNLPRAQKLVAPRYQDIRGKQAALAASPDGGALVRVIAGELAGQRGPGATSTPITMAHATISPGARLALPWRADFNALVYALAGTGSVGSEARPVRKGQLAVFGRGDVLTLAASAAQASAEPALEVLLLGGKPLREPMVQYGPFVMNTKEEVIQAFEDYQAGRFGVEPAEDPPRTV
ncbi:Pirin domain protein [Segniliparus rotundus DSM 44985]|uniref:Pirin domain protein n=1 Tax=Segniliparus rotundus (strain ATCC BAA-972 / CDC 1076 / CIP 108378 / DSM 44985 / JCM 13578) TaxID=640132 RepID=D6ZEI5_SEGRD|nr:pirin family protein [Segniliparus rotundus]ADG99461.1 Pirin domain protein [Segniliparus rotundus DSM 44985]